MFDTMSVDKKSSLLCYENTELPQYYCSNSEYDEKVIDKSADFNNLDLYRPVPPFMFPPFNTPNEFSPGFLANSGNTFPLKPVAFPCETSETELARCLGVRFDSSNSAWVARWVEPHSEKKKSRWFSVAKYGEAAARRLAIQAYLQNMRHADLPGLRDLQDLIANFTFSAFPPQPVIPTRGHRPVENASEFFSSPPINAPSIPSNSPFIMSSDQISNPVPPNSDSEQSTNNFESTESEAQKLNSYNQFLPIAANYMAALNMLPQVFIPPNEMIYQGVPQQQAALSTEPSDKSLTSENLNEARVPTDTTEPVHNSDSSECAFPYPTAFKNNTNNNIVDPAINSLIAAVGAGGPSTSPHDIINDYVCTRPVDPFYGVYNTSSTGNDETSFENNVNKSLVHTNSTSTNNGIENTSPETSVSNPYGSESNSVDNNSDQDELTSSNPKKRKLNDFENSDSIESYMNTYNDAMIPSYFPYQNSLMSPSSPHPNFLLPPFDSYTLDFASNGFYFSPFFQQHHHQLSNLSLAGLSSQTPTSAKMTCERGLHYSKAYRGNQECWIAVWNTKGGRIMHEAFQVSVMGFEQAKIKAREARDSAHSNNISINENSRPSWKSHSNTGIPHVSLDSQQLRFRAHKYGRRLCRSFSFGKRRGSFATKETAFDAAVLWLIQTPTEEEIASTSGVSTKNTDI